MFDVKYIENLAREELRLEEERRQIDAAKVRIITKKTFWQTVFPFKITIEKV